MKRVQHNMSGIVPIQRYTYLRHKTQTYTVASAVTGTEFIFMRISGLFLEQCVLGPKLYCDVIKFTKIQGLYTRSLKMCVKNLNNIFWEERQKFKKSCLMFKGIESWDY